jgi:hypothetical protein
VRKSLSVIIFALGASTAALAATVPEVDPGTGASALTLLAGAILLFRSKVSK